MSGRSRIRIHSDSPFFSGSEKLIELLARDEGLRAEFDISLQYRAHPRYAVGMRAALGTSVPLVPLELPEVPGWAARFGPAAPVAKVWAHATGLKYRFLARDLETLRDELRRSRPDVVHVQSGGYPGAYSGLAAAVAAKAVGARVIFMANNVARDRSGFRRRFDRSWDERVAGAVDVWVTGSAHAASALESVLDLAPGSVRRIPNGVPQRPVRVAREAALAAAGADPARFTVIEVANLEPRKGQEVLLRACSRVRDGGGQVPQVVLEGDGPDAARLRELAASLGLASDVVFPGRLDDIASLMAAADVLVLPSTADEDFPLVTLEAMSLGIPVIASAFAGIPEQIEDGRDGLLVPPGDDAAIAAALKRLMGDPDERSRLAEAGRERWRADFTAEACVSRWRELYAEVAGRSGAIPAAMTHGTIPGARDSARRGEG